MLSLQLLVEQYWVDKTRGLCLGAARGEVLSILASTRVPPVDRAAVPHVRTACH